MEPERHDLVAEDDGLLLPAVAVDGIDHAGDRLLGQKLVDERRRDARALRQELGEDHAAGRRLQHLDDFVALIVNGREAAPHLGVQADDASVERVARFAHRAQDHALARLLVAHDRQVVETQHDVLARHDDGRAVGRMQDVVGRHHEDARLELRLQRQGHVHSHLIAVEVGVEGGAHERMQLDRLALDQRRLERLDAEAVQRGRAVQHHRVLADHLIEDVPNLRLLLLDELFRLLHRRRLPLRLQARVDERLEQLERHLLGQPALVQFKLGADDDDGAAGVVDTLAEQVLAEAALLALQHVGERLQGALVGTGDDAPAAAVVEQRVDRLLQHALLVADDDVGRAQLHQPLQAVVAVDDAAVEVVQVGRGEAATVEGDERAQLRRDHRHHGQDHPLGPVTRLQERLDDLQTLAELLRLQVGRRLGDLLAQVFADLGQVHRRQHLADRLRADAGGEAVGTVLVERAVVILLGKELLLLEGGDAGLDDDVVLEIKDALEILERHVEQKTDARGQRLQKPDVGHGGGELDVAHALTADLGERHLDAALLADQPLVLHALVLAAQALVVLDRSEDARAEEAVALGLERAVVDRLRLLDLAERPRQDVIWRGDRDLDLIERRDRRLRLEQVGNLVHPVSPFGGGGRAPRITHSRIGWRDPLEIGLWRRALHRHALQRTVAPGANVGPRGRHHCLIRRPAEAGAARRQACPPPPDSEAWRRPRSRAPR